MKKFRTPEEVNYLLKEIQKKIEDLDIEFQKRKVNLMQRAEEIREESQEYSDSD